MENLARGLLGGVVMKGPAGRGPGGGERVEELTGLYGPVFFAEKQVQRIWATRSFRLEGLVTRSGKRLEVLDAGRWNFQEGPDFRDAVLEIEGRRRHGDVEIHLHEKDWVRHGHSEDPNFENVVLHVILFPDRRGEDPTVSTGPEFETLEWLKYLDRDLEAYFEDQGVDQLLDEGLPEALGWLLEVPLETREAILSRAASERWERKVAVTKRRIEIADLDGAFHGMFLEILGLKRNRASMGRLALEFPLEQWRSSPVDRAEKAYEHYRDEWNLAGCRPANHPRLRLNNYGQWIATGRGEGLRGEIGRAARLGSAGGGNRTSGLRVSRRRKELNLSRWEEEWRFLFAPGVAGSRFHTWIADGWLPLLQTVNAEADFFSPWCFWPVGDIPDRMKKALKTLEIVGPGRPLCNAWTQGVLRLLEPDYEPPFSSGAG